MEINFDKYSGNFNANISFGDISTSITYDGLGVIQEGAILDYSSWMQRYNNDGGPSFTGIEQGPIGGLTNVHWEHIPISFYNSWAEESSYVRKILDGELRPYRPDISPSLKPFIFEDESNYTIFRFQDSEGENNGIVEVHHPHDSLWVHGRRWNANSFTFPRDVAHPYLANSYKWPINFSVGVARPHISCYQMQYDKTKNIKHYILEPGPISLARFYEGCSNASWPINLWHFAPEWNSQFDPGYGYNTMLSVPLYTNNTVQANQWRAVEHFRGDHSLPMEINYEYPNDMVVPWLRDVSSMFAYNSLVTYKHRIEIPSFISNASRIFEHGWVHTFINSQNFMFDFDYNTAAYRTAESTPSGGLVWNNKPIMLDLSYMFNYSGWLSASLAHSDLFVYNNNIPDRNVRLPKRTINTAGMFSYTVFNFNIHLDSNIVQNTSNMFAQTYFNGDVNWYDAMPTTFLLDDMSLKFDESGKINDASNMFNSATYYNRQTWMPANGVNNAAFMYARTSVNIPIDDTRFLVNMASDSKVYDIDPATGEIFKYTFAITYDFDTNVFTKLEDTYENLYSDHAFSVSVPSNINNASGMFSSARINKSRGGIFIDKSSCSIANDMFSNTYGITNSIYVGDDCADINCAHMFSSLGININRMEDGFVYFGKNSMQFNDVFRPAVNRTNINVKYMTFDEKSGNHARAFFYASNFNIDELTIYNAFKDESSQASWSAGSLFSSSFIHINYLTIFNSFYAFDTQFDHEYGAQQTFANHYSAGEDIKRLDIVGEYPKITYGMFFNSAYTFDNGINISPTACISAVRMFYNCQHMVLNRTWTSNNRIFAGDPSLDLTETFAYCTNLYNVYNTVYEMPTEALSANRMFFYAHLYSFNSETLESMDCHDMYYSFSNCIIDNVPFNIVLHPNLNKVVGMFCDGTFDKQTNIHITCPEGSRDYSYFCVNLKPCPSNLIIDNMYESYGGWNSIVSVDTGNHMNVFLGENSICDAQSFFKHIRSETATSGVKFDVGKGRTYVWNISANPNSPTSGYWELVSTSDETPVTENNGRAGMLSYLREGGSSTPVLGYFENYDYQEYPYPLWNGEIRYINLPSKRHEYTGTFFRNTTYGINVNWLGSYPR